MTPHQQQVTSASAPRGCHPRSVTSTKICTVMTVCGTEKSQTNTSTTVLHSWYQHYYTFSSFKPQLNSFRLFLNITQMNRIAPNAEIWRQTSLFDRTRGDDSKLLDVRMCAGTVRSDCTNERVAAQWLNIECMWIKQKKNKKGKHPTVNGHFLPSPGCHGDLMTHQSHQISSTVCL